MAKSTWVDYSAKFKIFIGFSNGLGHLPELQKLSLFIAELYRNNLCVATVRSYLSAISFHYKLTGCIDVTKDPLILMAVKGLGRKMSGKRPIRKPITLNLLHALIFEVGRRSSSVYEATLFKALFSVMYYAALRVGEVGWSGTSKHALRADGVSFTHKGMFLKLHSYKFSTAPATIFITRRRGKFCPVKLAHEYLRVRPKGSLNFFVDKYGNPIKRIIISDKLRLALLGLGIDHNSYNCHSFRIGAATDLWEENASSEKIRLFGRWNSGAFRRYLKPRAIVR